MISLLRSLRDFFVSLKLTVVLLLLGMVLIFGATLDQVHLGIWAVQEKYFRSFIVYSRQGDFTLPIFPGGYLVGGLLLINLIAAHVYRFKFAWRKSGIILTHAGLILLLVGELLTGLWQRDAYMSLDAGQTKSYAESFRQNELVLINTTDPKFDEVVAIPEALLESHTPVQHARLPFRVVPKAYYPNSTLHMRASTAEPSLATTGLGTGIDAAPAPVTYKENDQNFPTAFVELVGPDGSLGTWLVSTLLQAPQTFTRDGQTWAITLRVKRRYQPFSLTLLKFSHDTYAGTDIPKNFSSRVRLHTEDGTLDREVLIYMNNPLRYGGLTFYQAGFQNNDRTTILQVVRNPSWLLPYLACALMSLGLVVQFGIHLFKFVQKRRAPAAARA